MGNTATSSKHRDRTYSMDAYSSRESSSPKADDKAFDFANSAGKKKPLLCYQSSTEYSNEDGPDDYKVSDTPFNIICHQNSVNQGRPRTTTISQGASIDENALPTVFKWEGGGKEVFITGTFSEWKPIKMCNSHGDFVAIIDVPEGTHEYKFVVDGNETVDTNGTIDEEKQSNVIQVKKSDFEVFEALAMDLASNNNANTGVCGSPPGSYSQQFPTSNKINVEGGGTGQSNQTGAGPPILPPHLLQVILNNPNYGDSTLLPQPNHVMLNHLYALSIKDGVMVLSSTHRYRKRYVTTLLYKPI